MADDPTTADEPATGDPAPTPDLGDAGKRAIEKERRSRREAEKALEEVRSQLQQLQDKDKSDSERLTEQVTALTKERDAALLSEARLKAALSKGLSEDNVKKLMGAARRITGDTLEDLEADAADYFEQFGPVDASDSPPTPGKPTEALSGGGDPTQEPAVDVRSVVDSIPRGL